MKQFKATEFGNIMLANGNSTGFIAWLRTGEEDQWLEVVYRPSDFQCLNVQTVSHTEEELAAKINEEYKGWLIVKDNLPQGMTNKDGMFIAETRDHLWSN